MKKKVQFLNLEKIKLNHYKYQRERCLLKINWKINYLNDNNNANYHNMNIYYNNKIFNNRDLNNQIKLLFKGEDQVFFL